MEKYVLVGDSHREASRVANMLKCAERINYLSNKINLSKNYIPYLAQIVGKEEAQNISDAFCQSLEYIKKGVSDMKEGEKNQIAAIKKYTPNKVYGEGWRFPKHLCKNDGFRIEINKQKAKTYSLDKYNPFYYLINANPSKLSDIKNPLQHLREYFWTIYMKVHGPGMVVIGKNHINSMKNRLKKAGLETIIA